MRLKNSLSEKEWLELFSICKKQSVASFVFPALIRLNEAEQKPPASALYEWIGLAEQVKLQNNLINKEAARITLLFEQAGHKTAILKGQANARLYSQPSSRQPGDIDIWVDGGCEKVIDSVRKLGLLKGEIVKYLSDGETMLMYHHLQLPKSETGIDIEVHYRPSAGNYNPFANKRMQKYLENEISQGNELVEEGFRVPNLRFALVMQLSHIQRHLVNEGVGMRQIIDYYYLLKSDPNNQRGDVIPLLKSFGLKHIAEALMWLLHEKLCLEEEYLIAPIDEKRGRMLLNAVMEGGNFGHYYQCKSNKNLWARFCNKHQHRFAMFQFDAKEIIWAELIFTLFFIKTIPARIKRRKWSLE